MNKCKIRLKSKVLSIPVEVTVLLPQPPRGVKPGDFYHPAIQFKVLWLLHPAFGDDEEWLIGTDLENVAPQNLMIVMPSALNSDYANHPEFGNGYNFPKFFFEELMPFIHNWFPASSKKEDNYIAGASMGGSGALMLGLMQPERFAGIAALSCAPKSAEFLLPYCNMRGAEFREIAEQNPKDFPTEFGDPAQGITRKEINMIAKYATVQAYINSPECTENYLLSMDSQRNSIPRIYFSCGEKDACCSQLRKFERKIKAKSDLDLTFAYIENQNHDFTFWNLAIRNTFKYFDM